MVFVISEAKLMRFFAEMHHGFERDLGDVLVFVGLLSGFLLLLSCASWLQAKKNVLARAIAARNALRICVREKALRRPEIILLEKHSRYLKPSFEKLSLIRSGAAMRSGDLPEGISLRLLDRRGGNRAHGRLIRNGETGLVIELGEPFGVPPGAPIQVSCRNGFGVFVFPSVVRSSGRNTVTAAHSATVSRIQRRAYCRMKLAKPVYVKAAGSKDKPLRSALFDLRARVVRLTPETAHVSFDCVPDPVRDRIIGYLFKYKEA